MAVYLSNRSVRRWSDHTTWNEARRVYHAEGVSDISFDGDIVHATVNAGHRPVYTRFRILDDGTVLSDCPCPQNQIFNTVCIHVMAAGLAVAELTEDPQRERTRRIGERIRADKANGASPKPKRLPDGTPGTTPATLRLRVPETWRQDLDQGQLELACRIVVDDKRHAPGRIDPQRSLSFSERDIRLLYVIEDMAKSTVCPNTVKLTARQFGELLTEMTHQQLWVAGEAEPLHIKPEPALSVLTLNLDPQSGIPTLHHRTEPEGHVILETRQGVWMQNGREIHALEKRLPATWRKAYGGAVEIPREQLFHVFQFWIPQLEQDFIVENEIDTSTLSIKLGIPVFEVGIDGGSDTMHITLHARYGTTAFDTARPPAATDLAPLDGDPFGYCSRTPALEHEARQCFLSHFHANELDNGDIVLRDQQRIVHALAETVPAMRQYGWIIRFGHGVDSLGRDALWVRPCIRIEREDAHQFRLELTYTDEQEQPVQTEIIETALKAGQAVMQDSQRTLLLHAPALHAIQMSLAECVDYHDNTAYVSMIHAGFIRALADRYPHTRLTAPDEWNEHARQQQTKLDLPKADIPAPLDQQLRPYQVEGVNWLCFLERASYGGILADEMGLGKTVQALAWLLSRPPPTGKEADTPPIPAMVVCPTSLIHNWAREVDRFTPSLSYVVVTGNNRHRLWPRLPDHDLVITSYALLRRDIERYQHLVFSAVILDEAQHIKNRSTQNSVAAKRLKAQRRLVLTGTPIENSVNDLWSIMDFLMPGYLGTHTSFKIRFEQPISNGNDHAERALERLRMRMAPFMLRRLKADVAAELPEKVIRVASCPMHRAQQRVYRKLLGYYQDNLMQLVDAQGFDQSRFSVFSALLRLRQCCCHPALLKNIPEAAEAESGKMDLFFELLDEAIDGGHRVLVFSQFVQMLHILRAALTKRQIPFAYLDGSTRDRMAQVDRFNNNTDVPVFLVSLKAGGSGLNLTGADVVIHYDPWWNPAVEDQATDRTHRIGQLRTVYSIKLVTENSIEEKVIELQQRKRAVISAAMGAELQFERAITWEDVQELMRLPSVAATDR